MEEVFDIELNRKLDKLDMKKETIFMKIIKFIKNHKFFSIACTSFLILSSINFYLIYSFIKVLENAW